MLIDEAPRPIKGVIFDFHGTLVEGGDAGRWIDAALQHVTEVGSCIPGQYPSQHRSARALVTQLNRHGIHARPARNTALISLAADLPAAVLADLIGMNPQTAVKWSRLSQSDWTSYLHART